MTKAGRGCVLVVGVSAALAFLAGSTYAQTCPKLTLTPPHMTWLPDGFVGVPYSFPIMVSGSSSGQYYWQLSDGRPPPGTRIQTLGAGTGMNAIVGTPTTELSRYAFSICVDDLMLDNRCLDVCAWYYVRIFDRPDAGMDASPPDASSPDAPAPADAPTPDAPMPADAPAQDAPVRDAPSPDSSPDSGGDRTMCSMLKERCSNSGECCAGLRCDSPPLATGGSYCCADEKTSCKSDDDCCPLLTCRAGVCSRCRSAPLEPCTSDSECCDGRSCLEGICRTCRQNGEDCRGVSCCPGLQCGAGVCRPPCAKEGESCLDRCCESGLRCMFVCRKACAGLGDRCQKHSDCCPTAELCSDQGFCTAPAVGCGDCSIGRSSASVGDGIGFVGSCVLGLGIALAFRRRRHRSGR